jgi:CBS domain-containing protein
MSQPGELSLFLHRVRDLLRRPLVSCPPATTVVEVARRLSREGVGSVVIVDGAGAAVGIVTDRDLRRKVVAEGRDAAATPASAIMSAPLVTLRPGAFAFEALLAMTRHRIRHVVVAEDGRALGVVSSRDLLVLQSTHPVTLAREIDRAVALDQLAALGEKVTALVDRLVREGGTPYDVGQLVAELNDRLVVRALGLAAGALEETGEAAPPLRSCWLLFGSEARREQTLRTDQDNGLLYEDPSPDLAERARAYFTRFGEEAIRALVRVGFPRCPGDAMASNPAWCQPATVWAGYFQRWMETATPQHVLAASIYFDLRPLTGATELAARLRGRVQAEAPHRAPFLAHLAGEVVDREVPLTLFGGVAVARSGPHRGRVDLKAGGGLQLVGAARVQALALGLDATNTVDRFRAAAVRGAWNEDEVREITDAYQHLMRLRLLHQLDQVARGEPPDNHVVPGRLSRADALLLREALKTVRRVQEAVRDRFATDFVAR